MAKKILLVDDDTELCEELSEILRDEGYLVRVVSDGKEGKKEIERFDYDLLILDFKMPGLNGIEILKQIKGKSPACKFFLISGKPHLERTIEEEKLTHLVDGIMQKPFDVESLLQAISSALSPTS